MEPTFSCLSSLREEQSEAVFLWLHPSCPFGFQNLFNSCNGVGSPSTPSTVSGVFSS